MAKKLLFTAGQFAQIHALNKRTLQYYDDIGLFQPQARGENNYRYYSYQQSPELELILAMREMKMSIAQISDYLQHPSPLVLAELVAAKTTELDITINRLQHIRELLKEKERLLRFCIGLDTSTIDFIECGEESLLLSPPLREDAPIDKEIATLMAHIKELDEYRMFNNQYGTVVDIAQAQRGEFGEYRFFSRIRDDDGSVPVFLKPAGRYLRAFCRGDWGLLPHTYQRVFDFAQQHHLQLSGYAYEMGLNEMAVGSVDEVITQVTVLCQEG